MSFERKSLEVKVGEKGEVEAIFSTFGVTDRDGDIVTREALLPYDGLEVPMVTNHDWSLDGWVGKGRITVGSKYAKFSGQFMMDDPDGAAAYRKVKAFQGISEWSWSFRVGDSAYEERDGRSVRVIKTLAEKPFEVSPVLVGAGMGTATTAIKAIAEVMEEAPIKAAIRELVLKAVDEERERGKPPPEPDPSEEEGGEIVPPEPVEPPVEEPIRIEDTEEPAEEDPPAGKSAELVELENIAQHMTRLASYYPGKEL